MKYVLIGKNTDALEPMIRQMQLQGAVFTIPQLPREDIVRAYSSAWAFLSPSLSEGLSLVSLEAMACGLPLIVTDVPGNADIVKDNDCGLIAGAKNPQQIAEALIHLLTHPQEYERYRQRSLERAPLYDWNIIAGQYMKMYRHLIAPKTAALMQARTAMHDI